MIEIIAPADRTDLTTIATVKQAMGIKPEDESNDGAISRLIAVATDAIQEYVGHILCRQTYRETVSGDDSPQLLLTATPIVSVSSIIIDSDVVVDFIIADREAGILHRKVGWARSAWVQWGVEWSVVPATQERNVFVTYVAGYLLPGDANRDLPARYEQACVDAVVAWVKRDQRGGADVVQRDVGDLTIKYAEAEKTAGTMGLPMNARARLGRRVV